MMPVFALQRTAPFSGLFVFGCFVFIVRGDCTLLALPLGWLCALAGKDKCVQCALALKTSIFLCVGKK